ncbi:MAG: glycosyltransferase family 39 protein [Anaerolineales bacterium]|nr:glycosyltransferase family 39 protein [Anaerolineales bacterium]
MLRPDKPVSEQTGEKALTRLRAHLPQLALATIVAGYFFLGTLYALNTPAWQVPDEPAHYNVIRQIAQTGRLPALEQGDYDQAYLERLTRERFPPDLPLDRVQYQDYQPPLYYLFSAPVFLAFDGSLLALRLFTLLIGVGDLLFVFLALRELSPRRDPTLALTAVGFMAFIPQHIAMTAAVNNDALAELLIAAGLFLVLRSENISHEPYAFIRGRWPFAYKAWLFGLVLGLAFLTKVQAYVLAPVFALYVFFKWRRVPPEERAGILRWGATMFGLGLALGALYWGRNFFVCGPFDAVCGNWHNRVVMGQPTTAEWIAQHGLSSTLERFFTFTFKSFWGVFGWMGVFMDGRIYRVLAAFSVLLVVGFLGAARGWRRLNAAQREAALLLSLSLAVTVGLYLYYNVNFVQHQGRYLFPALVPLSAAAALSLWQWGRWLEQVTRTRLGWLVPLGTTLALAALCLLALYRFIIPALA